VAVCSRTSVLLAAASFSDVTSDDAFAADANVLRCSVVTAAAALWRKPALVPSAAAAGSRVSSRRASTALDTDTLILPPRSGMVRPHPF